MKTKILASEYIVKFLEDKGITHIFELTGGMISYLLDAFQHHTSIEIVSVHHEQAAAFAADAYSRVNNIPGVALASSGPGAINLLTGIGNCFFDSVPAIFITGQVNTNEQKGDSKVRQLGFQETDIVAMAQPVCKKAYRVTDVNTIPQIFEEAYAIAVSNRPGPVLIDIPMNLQRTELEFFSNKNVEQLTQELVSEDPSDKITGLIADISTSKRPLILAGRGIRSSASTELFEQFYNTTQIPVITSLLGIDLIEYSHPLRAGFIGVYGNRWSNMAIGESDLIIVIGSRLDIRQTGADTNGFKGSRTIYHIDCEEAELNFRISGCHILQIDIQQFLQAFNEKTEAVHFEKKTAWITQIENLRDKHPDTGELKAIGGINPNKFIHALSQVS